MNVLHVFCIVLGNVQVPPQGSLQLGNTRQVRPTEQSTTEGTTPDTVNKNSSQQRIRSRDVLTPGPAQTAAINSEDNRPHQQTIVRVPRINKLSTSQTSSHSPGGGLTTSARIQSDTSRAPEPSSINEATTVEVQADTESIKPIREQMPETQSTTPTVTQTEPLSQQITPDTDTAIAQSKTHTTPEGNGQVTPDEEQIAAVGNAVVTPDEEQTTLNHSPDNRKQTTPDDDPTGGSFLPVDRFTASVFQPSMTSTSTGVERFMKDADDDWRNFLGWRNTRWDDQWVK